MHRGFLMAAAVIGALSVALGAFAAHTLRQVLPPDAVATFETGVRYQFYHCFALLAVAIVYEKFPGRLMTWAGYCFQVGILLFSGSLYLMTALRATETVGIEKLGLLTPFGGLFFIVGWMLMLIAFVRKD
ncbi:MAG TPA: DUF423 domain-containing protein [Chitinophagaceae bacterium]|nr:DUF423 domain-containing protein [Chitinophagaceae bacterium]